MMHRNLDRRVEALVRLVDPAHTAEVQEMFDLAMADTTSSWHLESDGEWTRHSTDDDGRPLADVQNVLMRKISARKRSAR